jgi:hypothetical protein
MENSLPHALVATRPRRSRLATRVGHRFMALAVLTGWVLMPLMPILALALSWFTDPSSWGPPS